MSGRICSTPGCEKRSRARGLCDSCYRAQRRHGGIPSRVCTVDGCDRAHLAKGLCSRHYYHWKTHGDPEHEPYSGYGNRDEPGAPVLASMWLVTCGLCGQRLGTIPAGGTPWPAIDNHTCEEKRRSA